jgi:hypothetical protein
MAEYRIPVQMDIIGTGDTETAAAQAANAQFLDVVQAFNGSYNGEAEPLDGSGAPTAAAVRLPASRSTATFPRWWSAGDGARRWKQQSLRSAVTGW